jgi:hypothetical protein
MFHSYFVFSFFFIWLFYLPCLQVLIYWVDFLLFFYLTWGAFHLQNSSLILYQYFYIFIEFLFIFFIVFLILFSCLFIYSLNSFSFLFISSFILLIIFINIFFSSLDFLFVILSVWYCEVVELWRSHVAFHFLCFCIEIHQILRSNSWFGCFSHNWS